MPLGEVASPPAFANCSPVGPTDAPAVTPQTARPLDVTPE